MRRALCVGIDNYEFGPLRGCMSDARCMAEVLSRHEDGSPNFSCNVVVAPDGGSEDDVTSAILRKRIHQLFKYPADVALLHFSGHGTFNDLDGYLVTQDAHEYHEGVAMTEVLKMANASRASEVVIFLDCCHSGQFGQVPVVDNSKAILREGVSVLAASRGDEPSVEVAGGGLFTSLVLDALRGGAADLRGHVSAPGIYAFVEAALGAWEQRPLFKSHVSKVIDLRRCHPAVPPEVLRGLPTMFPLPAEDLPLDPTFEHTSSTKIDENAAVFAKLQELYRVHLVVPVDADHMYDAAMNSKACKLTAAGRYYWRLAKNNAI